LSGIFLVLSGPAGAGKDAVTRALEAVSDFRKFPSITTRPMRPGESPVNPYTFVSEVEFDALRGGDRLWNETIIGGHRYGIQKKRLEEAYLNGEHAVLHLTPQWGRRLKIRFADTALVLLRPPSLEEQIRRLRMRGAGDGEIAARMADAEVQDPADDGFDLVVTNRTGHLNETVRTLVDFLRSRYGQVDFREQVG
jgi:guanylate kinase